MFFAIDLPIDTPPGYSSLMGWSLLLMIAAVLLKINKHTALAYVCVVPGLVGFTAALFFGIETVGALWDAIQALLQIRVI